MIVRKKPTPLADDDLYGLGVSERIRELVAILSKYRFRDKDEDELQQGIAAALTAAGLVFRREGRLTPEDRVDFLIGTDEGGIVIEAFPESENGKPLRYRCLLRSML